MQGNVFPFAPHTLVAHSSELRYPCSSSIKEIVVLSFLWDVPFSFIEYSAELDRQKPKARFDRLRAALQPHQ